MAQSVRYAIERKSYETRLARLALHDPLTGLRRRPAAVSEREVEALLAR